ncbi:MAG: hypothetical protein IJK05_00395 [Bacteroidales bacterium]|nr:hypothetical protein [Bacteroidales bacterium]
MEGAGNLKSLTMDELTRVINIYPWFGAARRELCERMSKVGGNEWGKERYAEAAMYISSRSIISDIARSTRKEDYSDKDVESLLQRLIAPQPSPVPEPVEGPASSPTGHIPVPEPVEGPRPYRRVVKVAGGDFFSSEQYDEVKTEEDNYFSKYKVERSDESDGRKWEDPEVGFCTETLAWIYASQGYPAEAKKIYSRLMLRYPEKITYFATLIEKLDEKIKK